VNILLISASPRGERSQTLLLAREIARGCGGDCVVEEVSLGRSRIEFCRHCELCHRKVLECPIKDDVPEIIRKMLAADGLILAGPNYINQVTASMKALFDRSSHFIHCLRLLGKYVVGAVTSGSGYDVPVLDYTRHYANVCGARYSGGVSAAAHKVKETLPEAYALGERLVRDISGKTDYPDQRQFIEEHKKHFGRLILMRKDDWTGEYDYWKAKGWL